MSYYSALDEDDGDEGAVKFWRRIHTVALLLMMMSRYKGLPFPLLDLRN